MPLYERACAQCGNRQEALEPITAPMVIDCPECAAKAFAKQPTRASFEIKGAAYRNGYE